MNKFTKAMTSLLTTVILVGGLSVGTVFAAEKNDPNEPNDTYDKATSMEIGKTYNGEIGDLKKWEKKGVDDEDWFKIKLTKGQGYKFTLEGFTSRFAETTLIISGYCNKDNAKNKSTDLFIKSALLSAKKDTVDFAVEETGTYYFRLYNFFNYNTATRGPLLKSTTYKISIKEGTLPLRLIYTNNGYSAVCGSKIQLYTSYDIKSWTSSDKNVATVTDGGLITLKQAGPVLISGKAGSTTQTLLLQVLYKDVTNEKNFWYEPTNALTNQNVVKGYNKQTKFKPANECTRAQMVTFLWRLNGSPKPKTTSTKFTDIKKDDYFYKAVLWAVERGITTGTSKTTFSPKKVCTRAQTVTFLYRMAGSPSIGSAKNPFTKDVKKSDYFYNAVIWASKKKIVAGYDDGTFRPKNKCLRRQMVTFLYKYENNVMNKK
ncbi:MAG: S-layer homology domain-containing protein [Saccharofermentans sp.]|nr:S-layer homology domain-containing protein [Saccharofermentans sp.]